MKTFKLAISILLLFILVFVFFWDGMYLFDSHYLASSICFLLLIIYHFVRVIIQIKEYRKSHVERH